MKEDYSIELEFDDEYVLEFTEKNSMTPIDIVAEITGLSYEEIRSNFETVSY